MVGSEFFHMTQIAFFSLSTLALLQVWKLNNSEAKQ